tara:strand:- start:2708 stop:3325 length:618 start_codon:yes stop_codon:yes gene_type:complete
MNKLPESVFHMTNNNDLNDICKIIYKNLSNQTGDELFDIIENDIQKACTIFLNKWNPCLNKNGKLDVHKNEFIKEMKLLFSILYLHYANENLLNEITNEMMNEDDPEEKSDIDEYLYFIECLKTAQHMETADIEDINSKPMKNMQYVVEYLTKKTKDIKDMNNAMENLNNSLEKLTVTLENYVECNNTLDRIKCIEEKIKKKKED